MTLTYFVNKMSNHRFGTHFHTSNWLHCNFLFKVVFFCPDMCRRHSDCHKNAKCDVDEATRRYVCVCDDFYDGDGLSCYPAASNGLFLQFVVRKHIEENIVFNSFLLNVFSFE